MHDMGCLKKRECRALERLLVMIMCIVRPEKESKVTSVKATPHNFSRLMPLKATTSTALLKK